MIPSMSLFWLLVITLNMLTAMCCFVLSWEMFHAANNILQE